MIFCNQSSTCPRLEKMFPRIVFQTQFPGIKSAALEIKIVLSPNNSWNQQFVESIKSQPQSVFLGSIGAVFHAFVIKMCPFPPTGPVTKQFLANNFWGINQNQSGTISTPQKLFHELFNQKQFSGIKFSALEKKFGIKNIF